MREPSTIPARQRSRTFLAFLALLFSILLCLVSFHGGAFGAVVPANIITDQYSYSTGSDFVNRGAVLNTVSESKFMDVSSATHLLIEKRGSEGLEPHRLLANQQASKEVRDDRLVKDYLRQLDHLVASRRAVDRAA